MSPDNLSINTLLDILEEKIDDISHTPHRQTLNVMCVTMRRMEKEFHDTPLTFVEYQNRRDHIVNMLRV